MTNNNTTNTDFLVFPANGYTFDTHTEIQSEFINKIYDEGTTCAIKWLLTFKEQLELCYPKTLKFEWKDTGAEQYTFELSKNADFSDAITIQTSTNYCEVDNLEIGRKYFWRVNNCKENYFFTKDSGIRFLHLDGALNVRDMGGNKIEQGLLYRGSDIYTHYPLTDEGLETFKNTLKVKTELELRAECVDDERFNLDDIVNIVYRPYRPYKEVFEEKNKKIICDIMEVLACEDNYPIYMNCFGGADRTGTVAIFVRAIMGEPDDFILMEYEATSLSSYAYGVAEGVVDTGARSRNGKYFQNLLNGLEEYAPGKTLHEKVTNFLLDCGVPQETLDKIVHILQKKS